MFSVSTCRRRQDWHRPAPNAARSSNSSAKSSSEALLQRRSAELDSTVSAKAECHGMPWDAMGWDKVQHHSTSYLQIWT
jgi:hypothetical protein